MKRRISDVAASRPVETEMIVSFAEAPPCFEVVIEVMVRLPMAGGGEVIRKCEPATMPAAMAGSVLHVIQRIMEDPTLERMARENSERTGRDVATVISMMEQEGMAAAVTREELDEIKARREMEELGCGFSGKEVN